MGSECCSAEISPSMQTYQTLAKKDPFSTTLRQGKPSRNIGINIYELTSQFNASKNWQIIQDKIFTVIDLEGKRKVPLEVKRGRIAQNQLTDPYYIPCLKAFYVGQWVYQKKIAENVPGGLGRLYEQSCIAEGSFETKQAKIQPTQTKLDLDIEELLRQKTREQLFDEINKSLLQPDSININVQLNGVGRIYDRQKEISGSFVNGKLNGKGKCIINRPGESYFYEGDWKDGIQHGKGKEKTKLTEYDGYFVKGIKEGKGIQMFYLSIKKESHRKKEEEAFEKKMKEDGNQMKEKAKKQFKLKRLKEQRVVHTLRKYPWKRVFAEPSIFQDDQFYFDRKYIKNFLEQYNGEFKNDTMHGRGIYVWWDGKTYNGEWKNGKMNGKGQFYWQNGSIYRGQYEDDLRHGQGIMIWKLEKRYRGFWAFGVRHGYGEAVEVQQDSITIKGAMWERDKIKEVKFQKTVKVQGLNQLQMERNLRTKRTEDISDGQDNQQKKEEQMKQES